MKYYKDNNNVVFAYEADGSQDHLIGDKTEITKQEADELQKAKKDNYFNSLDYSKKRELEYPDFRNYLDGIVKNDQAQIDKYIADCKAVKVKYPKG